MHARFVSEAHGSGTQTGTHTSQTLRSQADVSQVQAQEQAPAEDGIKPENPNKISMQGVACLGKP